jgi:hypothetical protein
MAQNITNDPAFKKKLEQMTPQMPRLGGNPVPMPSRVDYRNIDPGMTAEQDRLDMHSNLGQMAREIMQNQAQQMTPQMPRLNPETVEFPTLDAIAQQTAREVGVTPPPLSGEVEFPGLNQIGRETEMLVNAQQATQPIDPNSLEAIRAAGQARMDYSQAQMPTQDGRITSAAGLSDFMAGLNEQAGLPRTQAPQMATPESVAGLSITGTPLTQGAITEPNLTFAQPQAPQPQVPNIATPAPAQGQLRGMIVTHD